MRSREPEVLAEENRVESMVLSELIWHSPVSTQDLRERILPSTHIEDAEPIFQGAVLRLISRGVPVMGYREFSLAQSTDELDRHLEGLHREIKTRRLFLGGLERCLRRMKSRPCQCGKAAVYRDRQKCWKCIERDPPQEKKEGPRCQRKTKPSKK